MGGRLRAAATLIVILLAGAFLGSAVAQWWGRGEGFAAEGGDAPQTRVRVEVLNGAGVAGLASRARDVLRDGGYDVVYFGNAESFDRDSTLVLDRVGNLALARSVADALGVRRVQSDPDANLYLDVTVVLGRDWTPPPVPAVGPEVDARPRRWWDPRRWLER